MYQFFFSLQFKTFFIIWQNRCVISDITISVKYFIAEITGKSETITTPTALMLIPIDYEQTVNHHYNKETLGIELFEVHINLSKTTVCK